MFLYYGIKIQYLVSRINDNPNGNVMRFQTLTLSLGLLKCNYNGHIYVTENI